MIQVSQNLEPDVIHEVGEYLSQVPAGSGVCPEHNPAWLAVLRDSLGHQPYLLLAREGGESSPIVGYLPLARVSSRLFGRFMVSLPYLNRAGVVAEDPAVAAALIDRAVELAGEVNADYLELRQHDNAQDHPELGLKKDEKVRMVLELPGSADELWKAVNTKVRNQIRKGDKNDLKIRWGKENLLDDFYQVFSINMRDLGTPVYPRGLFASILEHLRGKAELAVVDFGDQPVAAALLVHQGKSAQVPSASSLRSHNFTNANMWMYHRMLLRAMERGGRFFDFGRSSVDSGTYRFKKQWGATPRPTVWQYHVRKGDISSMRPDSPKNRRRVETWKKLPVWVTRLVGPSIVRGIP